MRLVLACVVAWYAWAAIDTGLVVCAVHGQLTAPFERINSALGGR